MNFHSEESPDEAIRGTNDDATVSRLSAVQLGYFVDPFVRYFVRRPVRRSPIINRGSYIRSSALDSLVRQFLQLPTSKKKQIVSLGAGFDTRYYLLKSGHLGRGLHDQIAKYFELDFPEVVVKKAMTIKRRPELQMMHARVEKGGIELSDESYCLLGVDLREWDQVVTQLLEYGLDTQLPTLFLSECVLIYLEPQHSDAILNWMTTTLSSCMFVLYEQIRPNDAFGQMMIRNLQNRKIELKGIHAYPNLEDQERRFMNLGWDGAKAVDIKTVHDRYLSRDDLNRIARLEILDELEEWHLLAAHYCVAWAYKSADAKEAFAAIQLA